MHIAEVIYPGTWLDLPDGTFTTELYVMLLNLEDRIAEAAIALTMFEASINSRPDWRMELERDGQILQEVEDQLRTEVGDEMYFRDFFRFHFEAEHRVLRRKAELGVAPRSYAQKIPFMHAHSFLYAVDSFGKFLDKLCDYEAIPQPVRDARDEFNQKLPMVRKIRNSALHLEDRSRRYASWQDKNKGKRMKIQEIFGFSNLEGNLLCYTIDDGTYQKIAVNEETLRVLVDTINKVVRAFPWKGLPRIEPC